MKKALAIFGQFLLFLFVNTAGSLFYHPFGIETHLAKAVTAPRSFVWDGLVLMLLVFGLALVIETLRKRLRSAGPWSTFAFALAALAGYLLKFGFITHNW